jgi:hypothetical protein
MFLLDILADILLQEQLDIPLDILPVKILGLYSQG